jgi:hypothetical protein
MWGYASVFSASFAANIPLSFLPQSSTGQYVCDIEKDPVDCFPHYRFWLGLFALLAVPLSCKEFREQAVVQVILTVARIVIMFVLVGTALGGLSCDGTAFTEAPHSHAERAAQNPLATATGLIRLVPVCLFAFVFHYTIPTIAEPVKEKHRLPLVYTIGFLVTGSGYVFLATAVAFYFGNYVEKQASLSWEFYVGCVPFNTPPDEALSMRPAWVTFLSTFILIFPALDVLSAFPLNAVTLANGVLAVTMNDDDIALVHRSIEEDAKEAALEKAAAVRLKCGQRAFAWVCCRSTRAMLAQGMSEEKGTAHLAAATAEGHWDAPAGAEVSPMLHEQHAGAPHPTCCCGVRRGLAIKLAYRLGVAAVPIIGAAFVFDLGEILAWSGLVGVALGLTFPPLLRLRAQARCSQELLLLWSDRHEGAERPEEDTPAVGGEAGRALSARGVELSGEETSLTPLRHGGLIEAGPVERDDLVAQLEAELDQNDDGSWPEPSDAQVQKALHTAFDHSLLGGPRAAWVLVVASVIIGIVIVVGLSIGLD